MASTNYDVTMSVYFQIPQESGNVRSVVTQTVGGIDGRLFIGTTKGCILDGSLQLKFKYIVQVGSIFAISFSLSDVVRFGLFRCLYMIVH